MMHEALPTSQVLTVTACLGDYTLLRLAAPECACRIQPGQYLEITSEPWPVLLI